jgi:hypothetical protein
LFEKEKEIIMEIKTKINVNDMRFIKCLYFFTKYTINNVKTTKYLYMFVKVCMVILCVLEIYENSIKIFEIKSLIFTLIKLICVFFLVVPVCTVIKYLKVRTLYNGELFFDYIKINLTNVNRKNQYPHTDVIHFINEKDFIWIHYSYIDPKNHNKKRDYFVLPKYLFTSEQLDFILNTLLKQMSSKRE